MKTFLVLMTILTLNTFANVNDDLIFYAKNGFKDDLVELIDSKQIQTFNYQDNDGNTALHLAISNCHSEIINILFTKSYLSQTIDLNIQNKSGETPLYLATLNCLESIDYILAKKEKIDFELGPIEEADSVNLIISPLAALVYYSDLELDQLDLALTKLIKAGANLETKIYHQEDKTISPAFHFIAGLEFPNALKEAVKVYPNINERTYQKLTPLMLAVQNENIQNLQTLIDAKALLNLRDINGDTALHHAYQLYKTALDEGDGKKRAYANALLSMLVNAGADKNLTNLKNEVAFPSSIRAWRCKLNCDFKL